MADSDMQTNVNQGADKGPGGGPGSSPGAGPGRRSADAAANAGRQAADAGADAAKAGIDAEQRSFAAGANAGRQSAEAMGRAAQTGLKAGQDMARHSQDMARRASDQAADFWRTSLAPMSQLQSEVGRWFEQMWRQASPSRLQTGLPFAMMSPFTGHPLADLRETDKGYELCVDLPGMKPEEIELTLRGDSLVVSGEKNEESTNGQGSYRFSERRFGRFERAFALPPAADRSKIEANFADGVLRVTIPTLAEGDQPQQIEVKGRP